MVERLFDIHQPLWKKTRGNLYHLWILHMVLSQTLLSAGGVCH